MAEEFRLQQVLGNRRAVDRHEGARRPWAGAMQGTREELLAGAAGAADQHAGVGAGDQAGFAEQGMHGRAAADDLRAPVGAARTVVRSAGGEHAGEFGAQGVAAAMLRQAGCGAVVQECGGIEPVAGEHEDRQNRLVGVDGLQQAGAGALVVDGGEHCRAGRGGQRVERRGAVLRRGDRMAVVMQPVMEVGTAGGIGVEQQQAGARSGHRRRCHDGGRG